MIALQTFVEFHLVESYFGRHTFLKNVSRCILLSISDIFRYEFALSLFYYHKG